MFQPCVGFHNINLQHNQPKWYGLPKWYGFCDTLCFQPRLLKVYMHEMEMKIRHLNRHHNNE